MSRNPFLDASVASGYERWYETDGRRADRLEKALLAKLLDAFGGVRSVVEVGCGTGHFTRWFASRGLDTVGIDASPAMLDEARRLGSGPLVSGDALRLPFPDGAYDVAAMITALEFVEDPVPALREALRVSRRGLILGVLNRRSSLGRRLRREGGPVWEAARLFAPAELAWAVETALGRREASLVCRTTLWPWWPGDLPLLHGGFIGMAVRTASAN